MKRIILFVTLLVSCGMTMADIYVETALKTFAHCYNDENQMGTALAKCVSTKMKSHANPLDYKVNIQMNSLTKNKLNAFTVLMYNKTGYTVICTGTAAAKLNFTQCTSEQRKPLSNGQDMSILPP